MASDSTTWAKGQSGNPGGRPRIPDSVREAARRHTVEALDVLAEIASDEKAPPSARVQASQALLDRAWGRPTQHLEAQVGPLDGLSEREQRTLLSVLSAIADEESEDEPGDSESIH